MGLGALCSLPRWLPVLAATAALLMCGAVKAGAISLRHELTVRLNLSEKTLVANDDILVSEWQGKELVFRLAPRSRIKSATVDGRAAKFSFQAGRLTIPNDGIPDGRTVLVNLSYEALFDDEAPNNPVSFDNPGFGVEGSISENGVCLLPGCGWLPATDGGRLNVNLKVLAPRGVYAVTAGRLVKHEDKGDESLSEWDLSDSPEEPALSAGRYVVRSRMSGPVQISTYFFQEDDALSETYLTATESHIRFYENLHGRYPFPKFAVVENFFPTGYGFPSYTLLGSSVLRLPFIPGTSLKHEVAHSWWGNGVLVDYEKGNWCEGLTTYVADYLSNELISKTDAETYRSRILQDFATLAASGADMPLRMFTSRTSPASRAVGYGKAAFVFHMARRKLGEESFWRSLRTLYEERLFKKTSWEDIRDVFIREGGWNANDAREFFDQWLTRTGGPTLGVKGVRSMEAPGGRTVIGALSQAPPPWKIDVKVRLQTVSQSPEKTVRLEGESTPFELQGDGVPLRLTVDPDSDVFRLLDRTEIPPTVNSVKGAKELIAVFGEGVQTELMETFKFLLESLNHGDAVVKSEKDVDPAGAKGTDIIFFGLPKSRSFRSLFSAAPEGLTLADDSFSYGGAFSNADADCLFAVFRNPTSDGAFAALFLPVSGTDRDSLMAAARKITHYGAYSYLSFSRGVNRAKGVWPASASPLVVDLRNVQ